MKKTRFQFDVISTSICIITANSSPCSAGYSAKFLKTVGYQTLKLHSPECENMLLNIKVRSVAIPQLLM